MNEQRPKTVPLTVPRTDNLAAFAVGRALKEGGGFSEELLRKVMSGEMNAFIGLAPKGTKSITKKNLTFIPEYGGFDTTSCEPCGKTWDAKAESSMAYEKKLRNEWSEDEEGKGVNSYDKWLQMRYENYQNPSVPK